MEGATNGDSSHAQASDSSVKLMEIKIKTLDSQVYTCNVDQNISVPALKEQIATLTGVPVENQRLICRGKVLKDSHNLSAYNVEDGHTLHLVTRQVPQPSAPSSSGGANAGDEEQGGDDPSMAASRNRPTQIAHSVVMGTFNVPDNGDGGLPDVNRIISSVLQTLGIANLGANVGGLAVNPAVAVPAVGGQDTAGIFRSGNAGNQPPPLERGVAHATWPTTGPGILPAIGQQFRLFQQAMVIPDALTTISQYLDGLEQALATNGQHASPPDAPHLNTAPSQTTGSPVTIRGHPTPANLGAVIRRTMGLINGQAGLELDRLSSQLENEANLADAGVRGELQSAALRDGVLLQHLGALLLELGRSTLTLRMGTTAMESAVNAGPAVFISPAGPNPMMVQPLPFQPGAGFGTMNVGAHHNAGTMGFGEVPRNVSIHIHANDAGTIPGFPAPVQGVAPGNAAPQVPATGPAMSSVAATTSVAGNIAPSVHAIAVPMQVSNPSALSEQLGVRVVPMRTVVASMPASVQSRVLGDNTGAHSNLLHPLLARFQQLNSQQGSGVPATIHGTPPGLSAVPPPASMAQQSLNSATPTIRAQVQVQAWVPDGQGGSRLVTNEEALRTLLTQTTASSLLTAQQPSQATRSVSQSNSAGETNNVTTNANDTGAQQVSNNNEEPVGSTLEQVNEAVRVVPSPAEVDINSNSQGKDNSQNESGGVGPSLDVEMQQKDTTTNIPAGLGLRGLQPLPVRTPKRPARVASTSEQGVQNQNTSTPQEQGGSASLAGGQHNAQGSPAISDTRSVPTQISPIFQLLNSMPSRRGGGGNFDIGSLVSQFATSAGGTTGLARARDQDQGLGLPAGALSNLMGQVMQNPFMRNVVQQVVEQVGDEALEHDDLSAQGAQGATPQGASPLAGLDFSRLLQEMMPVVSQAINRASNTTGSEQASNLLQSINSRTGGENGVARGTTEAGREGSVGLEDMLSNGLSGSNGANLSAIFQQMMPAVAQAFGGALVSRPEQALVIPSNLNLGSVENGGRGTAARQMQEDISERDEMSQLGTGEPESSERPESAPVAKRQKIDVERALEKLEQGSSPDEILTVIAEAASMLTTATNNQEADALLLAQYLCQDNSLVNDYMALLLSDLTSYNQEENP